MGVAEKFNKARRYTKQPGRPSISGLLLFLLPLPLLLAVVVALARGIPGGVVGNAVAATLYFAGAVLTRHGLEHARRYDSRKLAVRSGPPLRLAGGSLVALATFVAALWGAGHTIFIALCFAAGSLFGFYLTYGFDIRRGEMTTAGGYSAAEVVVALEEAEERIRGIEQAQREIGNKELADRLGRIAEAARKVLQVVEEDPRDLRRARKFLNTYLEGAHKVAQGYAKTHLHTESEELETNFRNVLVTIEEVFEQQRKRLIENDVMDLDVQIEVLATQLKHEGIT